ncbi:MAG: hypothetical protein K6E54_07860 [Bacteroidaceae bacterium]|nr:hypothetical protein [Bacteroidaceae bacterium]
MDIKRIRQLLTSYYDGKSTQDEEFELLNTFANADNLPEDLRAEQSLFAAIANMRKNRHIVPNETIKIPEDAELPEDVEVPEDLESKILVQVDKWEAAEYDSAIYSLNEKSQKSKEDSKEEVSHIQTGIASHIVKMSKPSYTWVRAIAAAAIIIVGLGVYLPINKAHNKVMLSERDTFSDPNQAYAATEKALDKFAETIDKSERHINKANDHIENAMGYVNMYAY